MKLSIVRTDDPIPAEGALQGVRDLLFKCLRGISDADEKAWRKLWRHIQGLDVGELCFFEFIFPRNPKFHRKMFALLNVGFDAWEPGRKHKTYKGMPVAKNFETFREDILILAGFFDQTFDLHGRMKLRAKSISFASLDQAGFEEVYSAVCDVLLHHVLTNYKNREDLDLVVEKLMGFS